MPNPLQGPMGTALGWSVDSVTLARTEPRGWACFLNFSCAGWTNFTRWSEESEVFATFASSKGISNLAHHNDLITLPSSQYFPLFINNTWSMRNMSPKCCASAHSTHRRPPIICSSTNHPDSPQSCWLPMPMPIGVRLSWKWYFMNAWASSWRTTTVMIKWYSSVGRQRTITSRYKVLNTWRAVSLKSTHGMFSCLHKHGQDMDLILLSCFMLQHLTPCQTVLLLQILRRLERWPVWTNVW